MDTLKTNVLCYGDNLEILRRYIPDNSVDLVYLATPFNSKKDYDITVDTPPQTQASVTFAKAQKIAQKEGEQLSMQ